MPPAPYSLSMSSNDLSLPGGTQMACGKKVGPESSQSGRLRCFLDLRPIGRPGPWQGWGLNEQCTHHTCCELVFDPSRIDNFPQAFVAWVTMNGTSSCSVIMCGLSDRVVWLSKSIGM